MSSKRKRKKIYLNTVQLNRHFYIEKIKLKIERFFFEKKPHSYIEFGQVLQEGRGVK